MNKDKVTSALLKKFFDKSCTERERALVEQWLVDPKNKAVAEKLMLERWKDEKQIGPASEWNQQSTLQDIHARMKESKTRKLTPAYYNRRSATYKQILKIAAVILLPLVAAGGFWLFNTSTEQTGIGLVEQVNQRGQKSSILLPDGSKVWLNAASSLKYLPEFSSQREVLLEGEAFFDVIKNPEKPFVVKTRDVDVKVFGTSFNVSAYPDDTFTETTVVTGLVGVRQKQSETSAQEFAFVNPNEMAYFSRNDGELTIKNTDTTDLISWKEGRLRFDRTPFPVVIKKLQRWYGTDITYQGQKLQNELLTFTVTNESLEKILELMGSLIPIEFQFQNNRHVFINDN